MFAPEDVNRKDNKTLILSGLGAASGMARGLIFLRQQPVIPPGCGKEPSSRSGSAAEEEQLRDALEAARRELRALASETQAKAGAREAAIFEAQESFLDDPALLNAVLHRIARGEDAATAWWAEIERVIHELQALGEEPWSARAADLLDVGRRVLSHLLGEPEEGVEGGIAGSIVLTEEITASDLMTLARQGAIGLALERGSLTSHAVILARALGIPVVIGLGHISDRAISGTPAILDGDRGQLVLWPDVETTAAYERQAAAPMDVQIVRGVPVTRDGHRVLVMANVGSLAEASWAAERDAGGIGLLRTEFLCLDRETLPAEEEQAAVYAAVVERFCGLGMAALPQGIRRPVTVRTWDFSADKGIRQIALPEERNPALGLRGIRASLRHPEALLTQLRAIFRVAARYAVGRESPVRIMFPLVSTLEEWREARSLARQAASQLSAEGIIVPWVPLGMMIEVPAAALLADAFAREADFISLGTNDLAQYLMAADRDNPHVASLAEGLQPALLRLLAGVVEAVHRVGKEVSLCGELAADPQALPVLVGLGIDALSVRPAAIPRVKEQIQHISWAEAKQLADKCLACDSREEVQALIQESQNTR